MLIGPDQSAAHTGALRSAFKAVASRYDHAVRLLRASELGSAYEDAWTEWAESEDDQLWGAVVDDDLA